LSATVHQLGVVWVIAGAPGAGKSYFAQRVVRRLKSRPALIDKDSMYNSLIDSVLIESGRSLGERESVWYNTHIKPHTYCGMTAVARQIRDNGCDVVLTAPYTEELYVPGRYELLAEALGGGSVHLIWIRTDTETLRTRLTDRGLARDGDKLRDFDEYAGVMHLDDIPVAPHFEIDNRFCTPISLELQADSLAGTLAL
jgi:predicted kinase